MTEAQDRGLKFAYFLLGISLPVAAYFVWTKTIGARIYHAAHRDELHERAVEDSFPASDPPASW